MNKNASVTMAAAIAVAGILTLAVLTIAIQRQAFAQADYQGQGSSKQCCEPQQPKPCDKQQPDKKIDVTNVAVGGNGGSGGAGGAGGEGGQGGTNTVDNNMKKSGYQDTAYVSGSSGSSINQKANGGDADGGHGGNANGGDAST